MSTAKTGLPTSLTPEVLREILRYERRRWRAVKTRLVKKRAAPWEDMNVSDNDFYDKLHSALEDPRNRHEFEIAAKERGSQNRTDGLYRRIIHHYIHELQQEETFLEQMPTKATARQVIDAVSHHHDDDRLANVVWAILEDGGLSDADLSEIAVEYPGVGERLKAFVDGESAAGKATIDQWETGLFRLRDILKKADVRRPESSVVKQLAEQVTELQELALAAEVERSAAFSSSLLALMRKHATVLSDRPALKPFVDRVEQNPQSIESPEDEVEVLDGIDRNLRSLHEAVDLVRERTAAVLTADAAERSKLFSEISELHALEIEQYSIVENLFFQLFRATDASVPVLTVQPPVTPSTTASPEFDENDDTLSAKVQTLTAPAEGDLESDEAMVRDPETTISTKTQQPASDQSENANPASIFYDEALGTDDKLERLPSAGTLLSPTVDERPQAGLPQTRQNSVPRSSHSDDSTQETLEGTTEPQDDPPVSLQPSALDNRDPHSVAMETLYGMLSSRRFARAYWLTRADHTLGDPNLYGALCEGARIGPGDPCPGALVHFFSGLAPRDYWQEDERLLLAAAVLGSCLFVDPLPQDIYQLVGALPDDNSPVGRLMQRVRELCVFQNAKIHPEDLGVERAGAARTARLDQLRNEADHFLQRVPHIRFQYAPADFAVQYLYRAGSEWHRLHTIIRGDQVNRINEARSLVKLLDPGEIVASLHDDGKLTALKQPLDGRARDKLTRHLHDTLALSREWIGLASAVDNGGQGTDRTQSIELLEMLQRALPNARKALARANGVGAMNALECVLEDMEARILGSEPQKVDPIFGDLRLLSGLVLEDDLEPAETDLDGLGRAILNAEHSEPKPETILNECLKRREYRRARDIIEIYKLGEISRNGYEHAVSEECSKLEIDLRDLELEIENAFLLGQLRDDGDEAESADSHFGNALERSELLGVVRDTRRKLSQSEQSASDELRSISVTVRDVADKVARMAARRQERLHREFDVVMKQYPKTKQGEADREYLREAFNECIKGNDHVAAFDLLDRGRRGAQGPEPIVRASIGNSEDLERFLKRADGHRDDLSTRDSFRRLEDSIQTASTFSGIRFGQLDRNRRDEAARAVQIWHSLLQLRFSSAHRELKNSLEELLRFTGLPLKAGGIEVADTTQPGFAHIRVMLSRPVTASPLPAFGSLSGCRYEVVVSQTRKEPEQFEEYIRARSLAGHPVLALLLLPQSPAYRIRWQRHFARVQLTALPFDSVFLLHLCGERNRLPVLFELGLPFTWARPYITKGENVASEMFVGRSNETAALMDPRGSCIVFGGRQLGKSALLRHVLREHHAPENSIYVIYLDVDDLGTDSEGHEAMMPVFWRRVYDELIRCNAIQELPQKILNRDVRLVEDVPNSISTRLSENPHMRIVLLLDETDDLLDCDSTRDFALIRRIRSLMADTDRRFKAVFAGLQSVQRYYNWKNHPFAQLGEELVVNPLPPAAAQDLIIRPLRALGFAFENTRLVLRILSLTNYHPGLIQIIGYRLLDNLFDKWQRQDTVGPIRRIAPDDLLAVERDASVMEDIRNRFDWTLDLDDRYKVLTYALVLTPEPTAPRRESEFMAIGAEWWKAVFEDMDALGLRAVLDEMVGLGVLLREHDDAVRTYRLRSPNLLRLLGPQETIEAELLRIIDRERVSRPNPRNFHTIVDRKVVSFGPLSNEQIGQIYGQRRPFQLTLVTGSEALGLYAVERQFDKLLGESGDNKREKAWRKVQQAGTADANNFVKQLRDALKSRRRTHRYAVAQLANVRYEEEPSVLFDRLIKELGRLCTNESKAHLILLLGPEDAWRWLRDRNREYVLSQPRVTGLELRRWSDGAIANAFDSIEARTGSQVAGEDVFRMTSGFHWVVDQGFSRVKFRSAANAGTLVPHWKVLCDEVLPDGGTEWALRALGLRSSEPELESCVWEVLSLREESKDGRLILTDTSFELAAEQLNDGALGVLESHSVEIREWIRTMDLARPLNTGEEGSMVMATWVRDVIVAAEG